MKVERDRARRALTVSMPQKIEELYHLHAPTRNSGTSLPAAAEGLKSIAATLQTPVARFRPGNGPA
jgi:hypothetical protein